MTANKYSNGKIYRLVNNVDDEIYVGSTIQPLAKRKGGHQVTAKRKPLQNVYSHLSKIGWENVEIVLIENYPCNSKDELERRERYWIDELKPSLNKVVPTRTSTEWYDENKDTIKAKNKAYRETHKQEIAEQKKQYREDNKEKIFQAKKEYRERNKEALSQKHKEYREKNKEALAKQRKEYREKNKEILKEKAKQYRELNKEAITQRERERNKTQERLEYKRQRYAFKKAQQQSS